jgi:uncharacterized protein YndB with AHSA1/START domain
MKILKTILIVIVAIVALVLIVAAVADSEYKVVREVTIDVPRAEVFDYVKYLKNQDYYSVWATMDANMEKTYTGTDGTVGFVSAWDSDNKDVGKGEQEIIGIDPGSRIDYELRFYEPFEQTDYAYMTTEAIGSDATLVKWGFSGKMKYPMNLMLLFMDMDEMLGPDLELGLLNLKTNLE